MKHLIRRSLLLVIGLLIYSYTAGAQGLDGAWQIASVSGTNADGKDWKTENVQPGLWLFTGRYYSTMSVNSDGPRPVPGDDWNDRTLEDSEAVYGPFTANSGTYKVVGDSLVVTPMVAKWPNVMDGGSMSSKIKVSGDELHIWRARGVAKYHLILKRLK